jgi:hypothetical protein
MSLPENKQMAQVLGEMVSEEIVFYAGADFTKLIELFQTLNATRLAPILQALQTGDLEGDDSATRVQMVVESIKEDPDLLNVPELVFAFRIKDRDAAKTQLARLEVMANLGLDQTPLGAKFERRTLGDAEYIVLVLAGSMIPWPEEAPAGLSLDEESYDALKGIMSEKELYLALGVWNDYVIVSLSSSTDGLAQLGNGQAIGQREELASLAKHADRKLVGVHYVSRDVIASQLMQAEDLEAFASEIGDVIQDSEHVPEEVKERAADDLDELADDFKKYLPKPGAAAGYQFLTETGYEGFGYSWIEYPTVETEKPLELVQHLGGSPILALAARSVDDPEAYDMLVKWIKRGYGYFTDLALPQMDEEDREEFNEAMQAAMPLLRRADATTRDKLAPALADGQSGVVFDADITSKQWHLDMPASFEELPMAELAIVVGVSDDELLVDAMSDYRAIINDAIDAIREHHPDDVPEQAELPAPEVDETSGGAVYAWTLPSATGVNEQITLCGAVGDHAAAFATSRALAERVLSEQPLDVVGAGEIAGDEPRSMVVSFNLAQLVDALEPWIVYALRMHLPGATGATRDPANDPPHVREICDQVRTGLSIMKCFRGAWIETRREGDAWVTHSVTTFKDLDQASGEP